MASKIKIPPVYVGHGFKIYIPPATKPKHGKKPRIWILIRQDEPKKWRVYESLSYAKAADIQFVEE